MATRRHAITEIATVTLDSGDFRRAVSAAANAAKVMTAALEHTRQDERSRLKGAADERKYPCAVCGRLRTKAEGGEVFTTCEGPAPCEPPAPPTLARLEAALREMNDPNDSGEDIDERIISAAREDLAEHEGNLRNALQIEFGAIENGYRARIAALEAELAATKKFAAEAILAVHANAQAARDLARLRVLRAIAGFGPAERDEWNQLLAGKGG
jgi:hypothetical protein